MSLFGALLEQRASISQVGGHPSQPLSWLVGDGSFAGVDVTENNAMTYTAVYAAVRILAESIASAPIKLYRRRADGGKDAVTDTQAYALVHDDANPATTAFNFKECLQGFLCTWGNGYAEIQMRGGFQPEALWQRQSDRVTPRQRGNGAIYYEVEREDGSTNELAPEKMLHVPGLGFNGIVGFSPIRMARESIGLGLATERSGAAFFGNASMPGGFIKHPESLSPEGQDRVRNTLEKIHKGPANAFRLGVLDESMDWVQAGIPNEDAQFLETRTFQVQDVARWNRIPPHMLAELSSATFTNIEHQGIEFTSHTLTPWFYRWTSELNRKLLTKLEREQGFFFEFLPEIFLRGDIKTRYESYGMAIKDGWMSRNEVRAKENLNPEDGLAEFLLPQQTGTVGEEPPPQGGEPPEEEEEEGERSIVERRSLQSRWDLQDIFRDLLEQAAVRLVAAEVKAIRSKIDLLPSQGEAAFRLWLETFFEKHRAFAEQVMGPVLRAYMEAISAEAIVEVDGDSGDFTDSVNTFIDEYTEAFGLRHVSSGERQILGLLRDAETEEAAAELVLARVGEWEEKSALKVALNESTKASAAISRMVYAGAGVGLLVWQANRDACPLCQDMHGKTVEISGPFLNKGDQVEGDEETVTLQVKQVRNHPPLHGGCVCSVSPG